MSDNEQDYEAACADPLANIIREALHTQDARTDNLDARLSLLVARTAAKVRSLLADGTTPTEPALNGLEPGEIVAVPADLRNDPNGVRWEAQHPIRAWMPVGWQGFDAYPFARWVCRPITEEGQS